MNTIRSLAKSFFFLTLSASLLYSCKKSAADLENDVHTAVDQTITEINFTDAQQIADEAVAGNTLTSFRETGASVVLSACASITHDTLTSPKRITVNFGTANCLCTDGKMRRGKVIVSYTGFYKAPGSVITITFENYFVNDNQVTGTKTITNNGRNAANRLNWTIQVNGSVIKTNNGGTITWVSTRNREMIAGDGTPVWADDTYLITGNGTLTSSQGQSCTFNITTALRKEVGCKNMVSGVVDITPSGRLTRTLNFGTGACDNQATVTIAGVSFPITLP